MQLCCDVAGFSITFPPYCQFTVLKDDNCYASYILKEKPALSDLLRKFPSIKLPVSLLLTEWHILKPRFYSVSSSPTTRPGEVDITVSIHREQLEGSGTYSCVLVHYKTRKR